MKTKLLTAALAGILSFAGTSFPAFAHNGEVHDATPQTAQGEGVVKGVNPQAGTVTLKHGPIVTLKWPAMTMTFKVESAAVLNGVTVGEKVAFVLKNDHGKPVVTEIHPI